MQDGLGIRTCSFQPPGYPSLIVDLYEKIRPAFANELFFCRPRHYHYSCLRIDADACQTVWIQNRLHSTYGLLVIGPVLQGQESGYVFSREDAANSHK